MREQSDAMRRNAAAVVAVATRRHALLRPGVAVRRPDDPGPQADRSHYHCRRESRDLRPKEGTNT